MKNRLAQIDDIPIIVDIYNQSFPSKQSTGDIISEYHRRGIGTALIQHAISACCPLQTKHLFAIVLEGNQASIKLLEKMGCEQWGYLPGVAELDGEEVGHLYYGRHV